MKEDTAAMPASPFRRILVGWDASPAAHMALATAMTIADGEGVVIARAVLTPAEHTETGGEQTRDLESQRAWLREQFEATLGSAATHGARVRLEWGENTDIAADLTTCAEHHGCDLLIIGRHGEDTHLRTTGLGPVATAVTTRTRLPVLLMGGQEAGDGHLP